MPQKQRGSRIALVSAMSIFGTVGIFRRYIPLSSARVALGRAVIGLLFLCVFFIVKREKPQLSALRKNGAALLLSGIFLGLNWVLLFEAYKYTSVSTATLCYYMAPILLILLSPLFLRERLTLQKGVCAAVAFLGMVLVSGVFEGGGDLASRRGVLLGLGAALFYASIIILNKRMSPIAATDRTVVQFAVSALVLLPYVLLVEGGESVPLTLPTLLLLLLLGVLHTGLAYVLYFGAVPHLNAQTVALYSYLDPILAVLLSALLLREPLTPAGIFGAVLILGAAFVSERSAKK